jgi:excisionase family DNA binding protein
MDKLVYTVKELSKILDIGMNSAYCLVNSRDFPKIIVGRKILIPKKSLDQWIDKSSKAIV